MGSAAANSANSGTGGNGELITPPSTSSSLSASPISTSSSLNGNYQNAGSDHHHSTHHSSHKHTTKKSSSTTSTSGVGKHKQVGVSVAQKRPHGVVAEQRHLDENEDEENGRVDEDEEPQLSGNQFEFKSNIGDNEQPIDLSFKRVKTELSTSMY